MLQACAGPTNSWLNIWRAFWPEKFDQRRLKRCANGSETDKLFGNLKLDAANDGRGAQHRRDRHLSRLAH